MDDKKWVELAKKKKYDKYFGILGLLIVIMMLFFTLKNIGWLLAFIVIAVTLYYWIDMEQCLEDSKAINHTQKLIFIILGLIYELFSIVFVFVSLGYLLALFGIISAGYLGFKTNMVFRKGLKNKKLKFTDSIISALLAVLVATLVAVIAPKDILWLLLLMFALAYNLIHLVIRIKVEHDDTNRQI